MNVKTIAGVVSHPEFEVKTDRYSLGFLFDGLFNRVALIRKQKQSWQAGLLNGIGGKIEFQESAAAAMAREFEKSANYAGVYFKWVEFCRLSGENNGGGLFEEVCFFGVGEPDKVSTKEQEEIEIHYVSDITGGWEATISNLPWLVVMARHFGF